MCRLKWITTVNILHYEWAVTKCSFSMAQNFESEQARPNYFFDFPSTFMEFLLGSLYEYLCNVIYFLLTKLWDFIAGLYKNLSKFGISFLGHLNRVGCEFVMADTDLV